MSWLKAFAAVCFAGLVAGCGFVPIAAPNGPNGEATQLVVRDITILSPDQRYSYQLRRELDAFVRIDPSARYALEVDTKIERTGLAITETDEITRLNFTAVTAYRLVGIADDPVVSGDTRAVASVNATTDTFATEASERAAVGKLADATADKLVTALRIIALRESDAQ